MNEMAIDKKRFHIKLDIEAAEKLMEHYAKDGDTLPVTVVKYIEGQMKKVRLSAEGLAKVKAEIEANYQKRMMERKVRDKLAVNTLNPKRKGSNSK